ncbi:MAG: peptidoglycan-binding domain-containing protein [Sulfitobacter sp.]|nr:peptidoglycan-binding domain-containing protein [Sulfitobacter sp.]
MRNRAMFRPGGLTTALPLLAAALLGLAACDGAGLVSRAPALEPGVFAPTRDGPADAPPGTCWGRTVSPAVIQTVTEQIQVKPARTNPDGTIAELPVFRSETHQQIVTPRVDSWFETPCEEARTPEFLSSLQRALQARGLYAGPVSGTLTEETRAAVQQYQRTNGGPDSPVLALETARALGLIEIILPDRG